MTIPALNWNLATDGNHAIVAISQGEDNRFTIGQVVGVDEHGNNIVVAHKWDGWDCSSLTQIPELGMEFTGAVVREPTASDADILRDAVQATHNQFVTWENGLHLLGPEHTQEETAKGLKWLLDGGWCAMYNMVHDARNHAVGLLDTREKLLAAIRGLAGGAADVDSVEDFYRLSSAVGNYTAGDTWWDMTTGASGNLGSVDQKYFGAKPTFSLIEGLWIGNYNFGNVTYT